MNPQPFRSLTSSLASAHIRVSQAGSRVTECLLDVWPELRSSASHPWQLSPHASLLNIYTDHSVSVSISLEGLERGLAQRSLKPFVPAVLQGAVRSRQVEFLGGRLCAERALSLMGDISSVVTQGSFGEPVWPSCFHGSITHSDDAAHASVLLDAEAISVGIDSERVMTKDLARDIALLCCTETEIERWFPSEIDSMRMTVLFCVKEAFYKAVYPVVRRFIDFHEVEVVDWDDAIGCVRLAPVSHTELAEQISSVPVSWCVVRGEQLSVHAAIIIPNRSSAV